MSGQTILIIDDEANTLTTLARAFKLEGFHPLTADTGSAALARLKQERVDLILCDVFMPEVDGVTLLKQIRAQYPNIPVLMMSGQATIEIAVEATKLGATDFIEKPISFEKLLVTVKNALKIGALEAENRKLRQALSEEQSLIGESEPMRRLRALIERAAPATTRVLITGENGTGKELVARAIHLLSARAEEPFIKINCAAIPSELIESELFGHEKGAFTGAVQMRRGKFEQAQGGTLFLDEIGDMPLTMQAKLLRVLQEEEIERVGGTHTIKIDVRVIAATNKKIDEMVANQTFREDLYYRINVFPIHVPSLRERLDDLPLLANAFVKSIAARNNWKTKEILPEADKYLRCHNWPGNVRELRNIIERAMIIASSDSIKASDIELALPMLGATTTPGRGYSNTDVLRNIVDQVEREVIIERLKNSHYHITKTAESLGLERSHLYKKCRQLGIDLQRNK
ncbi:MAG: sigma-54 dependent transcriptional regulator [Acidobacteriota bacterium]